MELLFQNDKLVRKSSDITPMMMSNVSYTYLKYNKDIDKSMFSSEDKYPISHIYCMTNLNDSLYEEKILIGKNQVDDEENVNFDFKLIDFDEKKFIKNFELFKFENKNSKKLDDSKLKNILYGVFTVSSIAGETLYIVSDELGDGYNDRAIDILQQVYAKLPYFMRRYIGYNTYSDGKDNSGRIKLAITNDKNIKGEYIVYLDGSQPDSLNYIDNNIKNFVDDMLTLTDKELENVYSKIYDVYKLDMLTILKLIEIYNYILVYENRVMNDELLEDWIYDINRAQMPNSGIDDNLYELLLNSVKDNLDKKYVNDYIKRKMIESVSSLKQIDSRIKEAFLFIYYLETEFKFKIETDIISEWVEKKKIPELKEKYSGFELVDELDKENENIKKLEEYLGISKELESYTEDKATSLKSKLRNMRENALFKMENIIYEENYKLQDLLEDEKQEIKKIISDAISLETLYNVVNSLESIRTANREYMKKIVYGKVLDLASAIYDDKSIEGISVESIDYDEYSQYFEEYFSKYKKNQTFVEKLYKGSFISSDTNNLVVNNIQRYSDNTLSNFEARYYTSRISKAINLSDLVEEFDFTIENIYFEDSNKYKLESVFNEFFNKLLNNITASNVDELRNVLEQKGDSLSEQNIQRGYDKIREIMDAELSKIEDVVLIDDVLLNDIQSTILHIVNKKQNTFFRSVFLIPQDAEFNKKLEAAKRYYADIKNDETVFLIFDNTLFRTAQEGFVITDKRIYYNTSADKGVDSINIIDDIKVENNLIKFNGIHADINIIRKENREDFRLACLAILYLLQNVFDDDVDRLELIEDVLSVQD